MSALWHDFMRAFTDEWWDRPLPDYIDATMLVEAVPETRLRLFIQAFSYGLTAVWAKHRVDTLPFTTVYWRRGPDGEWSEELIISYAGPNEDMQFVAMATCAAQQWVQADLIMSFATAWMRTATEDDLDDGVMPSEHPDSTNVLICQATMRNGEDGFWGATQYVTLGDKLVWPRAHEQQMNHDWVRYGSEEGFAIRGRLSTVHEGVMSSDYEPVDDPLFNNVAAYLRAGSSAGLNHALMQMPEHLPWFNEDDFLEWFPGGATFKNRGAVLMAQRTQALRDEIEELDDEEGGDDAET